jgi:hemerythrin-like domain-containing protein
VADILELIHRDHANLGKLLDAVEAQLDRFDRGEMPDYDILRGVAEYCLNYPDLYHHPAEDLLLRRLRVRDPESAAMVGDLEAQHQALSAKVHRFRDAVDEVLKDLEMPRAAFVEVARDFVAGYRHHMRKEEEAFLPAAARALSLQDRAEVSAEAGPRSDPLGDGAQQEFEALRQKLMRWAGESR